MKKLVLILTMAALGLTAGAQVTNGVKITQLNAASLPLTGTELVALVQGGTTKATAVANFSAAAQAAALAAANSLSNLISAETLARISADSTASNANAVTVAGYQAGDAATSNALKTIVLNTSNALATALAGYYPTSNPASYQSAGDVSTTVATALAAAGVGSTNTGTIQTTNLVFNVTASTNNAVIDMAKASAQTLYLTGNLTLTATNSALGQQVNVLMVNNSSLNYSVNIAALGLLNYYGSASVTVFRNKSALLTLSVFGTGAAPIVAVQAAALP